MSPLVLPVAAAMRWSVKSHALGSITIPVGRIEIELYLPVQTAIPSPIPWIAWLDTAAPLSIIPYRIHGQGLIWRVAPGILTTWAGIPCDVGHLDVWLLDRFANAHRGPYRMLAKFPRRDPPGDPSPLLVGLEFVLAHQGEFHMPAYPANGELRVF